MLNAIKVGCRSWLWSLGVLARSPLYVLALAVLLALWGIAAYEWLWLPESSALVLMLTLVWALGLVAGAVAILALITYGASVAATGSEPKLKLRASVRFSKKRSAWTLAALTLAVVTGAVGMSCFHWLDEHALNVASFLGFHWHKPISHLLIERVFWTLETLLWIALGAFLLRRLLTVSQRGWRGMTTAGAKAPQFPAATVTFLTGVLGAGVFGGIAWLVAGWHPVVKSGASDYAQLVVRAAVVLLVISIGWLFCTLALARQALATTEEGAAPGVSPAK